MDPAILSHVVEEELLRGDKSLLEQTLQVSAWLGSRMQVC